MSDQAVAKTQDEKIYHAITHPDAMTILVAEVKTRVENFRSDMDLTSKKGRDEAKSFFHKVTKSKTSIQKATKAYLADAKSKIRDIEASVKKAGIDLDTIKTEGRAELTKWEDDHKASKNIIEGLLGLVSSLTGDESSEGIRSVITELYTFNPELVVEDMRKKSITVAQALDSQLQQLFVKLQKQEEDAKRLAKLEKDEKIRKAKAFEAKRKEDLEKEAEQDILNGTSLDDGSDEELVTQSIEIIRETQRASTSCLQRRLRIGYTRASRIIDVLEERGIVGSPRGSEPREILAELPAPMLPLAKTIAEETLPVAVGTEPLSESMKRIGIESTSPITLITTPTRTAVIVDPDQIDKIPPLPATADVVVEDILDEAEYPPLAQAHQDEAVHALVNEGLVKPQAIAMIKLVAAGKVPHVRMV
jgi:DNA segregation ATPase FtsK/SpoIIIE-like protein